MSRNDNKTDITLTSACKKLKEQNTPVDPCFKDICDLFAVGMKLAEYSEHDPYSQAARDHTLQALYICNNLVKMVAVCKAVPDPIAVTFVTGNKVLSQSITRECREAIKYNNDFKEQVGFLFGKTIAGFFDKNNPRRKQVCDAYEQSVAHCEEAEILLNQRYSSKS